MLDKRGYRNQVLPHYIAPFTVANRVAGPAFTGQGYPCASSSNDDTQTRLRCSTASRLARYRSGRAAAAWFALTGARLCPPRRASADDGRGARRRRPRRGLHRCHEYPVFAQFKSAASSIGRWDIKEYQVPIKIGSTVIRPGDFVFGDVDGVVIVPGELALDVLSAAETCTSAKRACVRNYAAARPSRASTQSTAHSEFVAAAT